MPPLPLSPAELAYHHASLSHTPPLRPDARGPREFRPLIAETDILPAVHGSARVCFADASEAVVGVKAEVERTSAQPTIIREKKSHNVNDEDEDNEEDMASDNVPLPPNDYISLTLNTTRDDDPLPSTLASLLLPALVASTIPRLHINTRFHWHLHLDLVLLGPSFPPIPAAAIPLLSTAIHLALRATRLPALVSEADEDPLFSDDWAAATWLYPPHSCVPGPPVVVLLAVAGGGGNVLVDPGWEEIAVAEGLVGVVIVAASAAGEDGGRGVRVLGLRTLDPPARGTGVGTMEGGGLREEEREAAGTGCWRPPRGGLTRGALGRVVGMMVEKGGVGEEVLHCLGSVEVGG